MFEKYVEKFRKLENYNILYIEEDTMIVGTKISLERVKKITTTFSYHEQHIPTILPIFFVITASAKKSKIEKTFDKEQLPTLILTKQLLNETAEKMKNSLLDFIKKDIVKDLIN